MNKKRIEAELAMLKLILTNLAVTKQVSSSHGTETGSYISNYLRETTDRTVTQISLLQEVLCRADEFTPLNNHDH